VSRWWRARGLRLKLTLWYLGAMLVALAVYASGVYMFVSRNVLASLDQSLRGDFQLAAAMVDRAPDGRIAWFDSEDTDTENPWLQVWSPSGELLYQNSIAQRVALPSSRALALQSEDRVVSVPTGAESYRILTRHGKVSEEPVVIQVARSEAPMRQQLRQLVLFLAFGLPFGLATAGLGGYSLARRALVPVERMAERARSITAERLSDRLPVGNPDDELGRLATVFNETLGRLESSFEQMRQFTADVSHELRTPLTAIRSVGEVGLRERRDEPAYRAIIGSMLEEVDRLAILVDRVLTLSRAESGQDKLSIEVVDLRALVEEVAAHLGVLAEEKNQSLQIEGSGRPGGICDRIVLRQALINLLDNAIKYTPAGGRMTIRLAEVAQVASIDVTDTGPGIPMDLRARIFDRYYRAGNPRTHQRGAGLGLAIAKWAVEVGGGHLSLVSTSDQGSTSRITLPRAPAGSGVRPRADLVR
jgi:heavy metal sensor kinase